MITAYWEDGLLHFETKSGHEYNLKIHNYGTASCCTNDTNGTYPLLDVSTHEKRAVSKKEFYELLGKAVDIYDPRIKSTLFYSHFQILNEDPYSNLPLPANGLTSFSEILDNYYYLTITHFTQDIVKVQLLTNVRNKYKAQIKEIQIDLELNEKFSET